MLRVRRNQEVAGEMIIVSPWIMVNGKYRVGYSAHVLGVELARGMNDERAR